MIKIENVEVMGWEAAIRGMRNPMNSWDKSDSRWENVPIDITKEDLKGTTRMFFLGDNDYDLALKLAKGGSVHAKYRRMITVYCDILAPLYWWKEFETYRVGVTPNPTDIEMNSCSTMHKIHAKDFSIEDFSNEHLTTDSLLKLHDLIDHLNFYRRLYIRTNEKGDWWQMIQLLPSSYNQRRTVELNYEVLSNIYRHRKAHKLVEWQVFCEWIKMLPYSKIITLEEDN